MIETAIILGAGFSNRVRPLSLIRPKPLFPVLNKTMLEWWTEALIAAGFKRLIFNAHYLSPLMEAEFERLHKMFGDRVEIISSLEEEILGTGGALAQAAEKIGPHDFMVINADIFTDFEMAKLAKKYLAEPGRLATLGLIDGQGPANVSVGAEGRIVGFRKPDRAPGEISRQTYAGVMAVSPEIFDYIGSGFHDIIDIFNLALDGDDGGEIYGWNYDPAIWRDMGTIGDYWNLNKSLASGRTIVHPLAKIDGHLTGFNIIGKNVVVENGASLEDCVIWPGAVIGKKAVLKKAVVAGSVPPETELEGGCFCDAE